MKDRNTFCTERFHRVIGILLILLLGAVVMSMNLGEIPIGPKDLFKTIIGEGTKQQHIALFSIRLPRIAIAVLVGGALAIAGSILQSVTGNDLAEPGILGINTGAALLVVIYIYITNGNNYYGMAEFAIYTMPAIALLGGMMGAALVYLLAWKRGVNKTRLLLMGIAVNAAFSALIIIAQLWFDNRNFNTILMWTSGSIWGTSWSYVIAVAPPIVILWALTLYKSRYLDAFMLGDEVATGLGVNVERQRMLLLLLAVALSGTATSVAGSVSFVGLIAPHIARKLVGPKHVHSLPTSMFIGMLLVMVADTIARNAFAPVELHLGIVVSIIGVPYFIYLMLQQ